MWRGRGGWSGQEAVIIAVLGMLLLLFNRINSKSNLMVINTRVVSKCPGEIGSDGSKQLG